MPLDLRRHFLRSLDLLDRDSSYYSDQFTLVSTSKILRDLLVESTIDRVSNSLRRHPRFDVPVDRTFAPPGGMTEHLMFGYNPYALDRHSEMNTRVTEKVSKQQFLAYKIFFLDGHEYSVKTTIKTAANGLGGVHFDRIQKDDEAQRLLDIDRQILDDAQHVELTQVASAIRQIGRATINACEMMRLQVLARTEV